MTKQIKIRIRDEEHSRQVQNVAFKLGYGWSGTEMFHQYVSKEALFFEKMGYSDRSYITYSDAEYFAESDHAEYKLVGDEFVPVETPEVAPPLGLRPRYVVEAIRIQEILSACTRYTEAAKTIPTLWLDELRELNSRVK